MAGAAPPPMAAPPTAPPPAAAVATVPFGSPFDDAVDAGDDVAFFNQFDADVQPMVPAQYQQHQQQQHQEQQHQQQADVYSFAPVQPQAHHYYGYDQAAQQQQQQQQQQHQQAGYYQQHQSPGQAQVQTPVNDSAMHAHTPGGLHYQAYPPAPGKWD